MKNQEALNKQLLNAASQGKTEAVLSFLAQGADIDATVETAPIYVSNTTPLLAASYRGHADIVQILVQRGATIDAKDSVGATALLLASSNGYVEIVRLLVEHGADLEVKDYGSNTPLMLAAKNGYLEIVRALLMGGANSDVKNNSGVTALLIAEKLGNVEVVALLKRTMEKQQLLKSVATVSIEAQPSGLSF